MTEVDSVCDREWVEFVDPADRGRVVRADLTWLLSRWACVYGRGCAGVRPGRAAEGCCSTGAYFSGPADLRRVGSVVRRLTPRTWQHHAVGVDGYAVESVLGEQPATRTATLPDGPCVLLNDADFPGGGGCALHVLAEHDGVAAMTYKPDVCWQLPIRWRRGPVIQEDGTTVVLTTLTEYSRRSWGDAGREHHWWCTSAPAAHVADEPLVDRYAAELTALIGPAAYEHLHRLCHRRLGLGLVAVHPATAAAHQPRSSAG
ncbi:hypothetical protein [Dactylosporangium sp. CA-139066]|uniref:hypothetical protein n=1 Tax=Dactylosporangium sp. CA-139066 TaxID=3239930 RepID=UPI003D91F924